MQVYIVSGSRACTYNALYTNNVGPIIFKPRHVLVMCFSKPKYNVWFIMEDIN